MLWIEMSETAARRAAQVAALAFAVGWIFQGHGVLTTWYPVGPWRDIWLQEGYASEERQSIEAYCKDAGWPACPNEPRPAP